MIRKLSWACPIPGLAFVVACSAGAPDGPDWTATVAHDDAEAPGMEATSAPDVDADAGSADAPGPNTSSVLEAATEDAAAGDKPTFDAGAGALQADGKTVVFHIARGTGSNDWNSSSDSIRVKRGMDMLFVDDDPTSPLPHFLHTFGEPCPHPLLPIALGGNHCPINPLAPLGMRLGVYDHDNGGKVFIEVVQQ